MQYSKCIECIHNGKKCKFIMAEAIYTLGQLEHLIYYSQSNNPDYNKCHLRLEYSCENFTPRNKENINE